MNSLRDPTIKIVRGRQLADYARLLDPPPHKAIVLPQQPCAYLVALGASKNVAVVWPEGESFNTAGAPIEL